MMPPLQALATLHAQLLALVGPLSAADLCRQYHPELSPLGWHLGHCAYVEGYWLDERLLGSGPAQAAELFWPTESEKSSRGERLPERAQLFESVRQRFAATRAVLGDAPTCAAEPALLENDFLPRFLLQHHAQHLETMHMVLAQRAHALAPSAGCQPRPRWPAPHWLEIAPGRYRIGSDDLGHFDNERPAHTIQLRGCLLARELVRNDEFLAFIADGGYDEPRWWSESGRRWLQKSGARHPAYWRWGESGWEEATAAGPQALRAEASVCGVSWYEAEAFAAWAGARLPHEYEREVADAELIQGEAWEWCANTFHPYPGFVAYPYAGYSEPWFDGEHRSLRGASAVTHASVRRASFRNFYPAGTRHAFAGLRLARDS